MNQLLTRPFFFADSAEQLFGIQTLPDDDNKGQWGALICHPLGQEYLRSYQALQRLSKELARAGVSVMRFDYYGTGDSAGDVGFADVARFCEDIGLAASELRESCGIKKLALVGLRMGATLAAHVRELKPDRLILLDPIVSGARYLQELESLHERLVLDAERYQEPRIESKGSSAGELLGFYRPNGLKESLDQFRLDKIEKPGCEYVDIVISENDNEIRDIAARWQASGINVNCRLVEADGNWNSLELLEEPLGFRPVIRETVGFFRQVDEL